MKMMSVTMRYYAVYINRDCGRCDTVKRLRNPKYHTHRYLMALANCRLAISLEIVVQLYKMAVIIANTDLAIDGSYS